MDQMISMFIDDEMDLDEKMAFVQTVQNQQSFAGKALDLLRQEKLLRQDVVDCVPAVAMLSFNGWKRVMAAFFRPVGFVASGFAAASILIFFVMFPPTSDPITNRFVIYRPDVNQVEITGTFTDWQRIPMHKIGSSGYWEVSLQLKEGEHRFTYILEGDNSFADPTILAREPDDFGGENSVLYVERKA